MEIPRKGFISERHSGAWWPYYTKDVRVRDYVWLPEYRAVWPAGEVLLSVRAMEGAVRDGRVKDETGATVRLTDTAAPRNTPLFQERRSHDTGTGGGADSPRGEVEGPRLGETPRKALSGDGSSVSLDSLRAGVTR